MLSCVFSGTALLNSGQSGHCKRVKFPRAFPSLYEHERGCRGRWAEPVL